MGLCQFGTHQLIRDSGRSDVPLLTPRQRSSVKAPPPNMDPTPALRIDNFMRPCTLPQVPVTTRSSFVSNQVLKHDSLLLVEKHPDEGTDIVQASGFRHW